MLVVGLTGGIASGKTLVAELFASHGVPVVDADALAREVVAPGSDGLREVVARFGADVLASDGSLDRLRMRTHVFNDADERRALEQILHPRIRAVMAERVDAARAAGAPYCLSVIPLLVETGQPGRCDRVLVVDAPVSVQIERLRARDGTGRDDAARMLASQASRSARLAIADDVVANGDAVPPAIALRCQVHALDAKYRLLASRRDPDPGVH